MVELHVLFSLLFLLVIINSFSFGSLSLPGLAVSVCVLDVHGEGGDEKTSKADTRTRTHADTRTR